MLETTPATVARPQAPAEMAEPVPDIDFDWRPRPLDATVGARRSFRWSILVAAAVLGGVALVAVQILVTVPQQRADARRGEYREALTAFEPALTALAAAPAPSDPEALGAFADASAGFAEVVRAALPTVIPLLPIGPIEELRPARSEMLAVVDAAESLLTDLAAATRHREAAAAILAFPLLPTSAPEALIDPAARAIADMQSATERGYAALDDDPAFAGYRDRVAAAIDALPAWADAYLLALRRGDAAETTTLIAQFQAQIALATAELESAVADVDAAARTTITEMQRRLDEARILLG
ncbi:MAG TPA: hypothetical protein DCY40_05150 [Actinobacteria bacterium]|nr:hypothetical protein [Actinomycetota bacterium]